MKKILLLCLGEAFFSTWRWFFGSFTASVGAFLVLKNLFDCSYLYSIIGALGLYCSIVFIKFIWNIPRYIRIYWRTLDVENIYGEAIINLAEAFAHTHHLRKQNQVNAENIREALVSMCTNVKTFFDKKTKSTCSVCIKVLSSNVSLSQLKPEAEIITLCRDSKHEIKRNHNSAIVHNIFNNSCFNHIFRYLGKAQGKFYLNNNLPADEKYENSSFQVYGEISAGISGEKERTKYWTLPYKSEIVVPITPLLASNNHSELLGFLCVDCSEKNVFNEKYDIALIQGVADGIYDLLERILNKDFSEN